MMILRNLLVATDFGDTSAAALNYGRGLARALGARLHVVHVVDDMTYRYAPELAYVLPDLQLDLEKSAKQDLAKLITEDDRKTLNVEPVVFSCVNVAEGLTNYAREHAIDLIVTGTHGRSGVRHLLIGSVAEHVVRTAPCPVLTVHVGEREFVTEERPAA